MKKTTQVELDAEEVKDAVIAMAKAGLGERALGGSSVLIRVGTNGEVAGAVVEFQWTERK